MPRKPLTCRQLVHRAEGALNALGLSDITQVGRDRIMIVQAGMRALDDEQADVKDQVANLLDSLDLGYSAAEVIEDLRALVKSWGGEEAAKRAEARKAASLDRAFAAVVAGPGARSRG